MTEDEGRTTNEIRLRSFVLRRAMIKPHKIQISKSRRVLIIAWDEGHTSDYPFDGLRAACPCAQCKGGHENMGTPPDPTVFDQADQGQHTLLGADLVGTYALQLLWADGHKYGLYGWEYLRGLCPCPTCFPAAPRKN